MKQWNKVSLKYAFISKILQISLYPLPLNSQNLLSWPKSFCQHALSPLEFFFKRDISPFFLKKQSCFVRVFYKKNTYTLGSVKPIYDIIWFLCHCQSMNRCCINLSGPNKSRYCFTCHLKYFHGLMSFLDYNSNGLMLLSF